MNTHICTYTRLGVLITAVTDGFRHITVFLYIHIYFIHSVGTLCIAVAGGWVWTTG